MNSSTPRQGRMVLLLIAGIPVTMILAATWLWYFVARGDLDLIGTLGTANRGALVQPPRRLDDLALFDAASAPRPYSSLEPKWTLLVPGSAACDAACEHALYLTRQIHIAIGRDMHRLRRVFVSETPVAEIALTAPTLSDERPRPDDFAALLERDHAGLEALRMEPGGGERLFPEWQRDPQTWYLVDPGGWIMMSYNSGTSHKDVMADLKFLLKNSGGG